MLNQVYLNKLINLVKRNVITLDSIKSEEYRDAVQSLLTV